MVKCYTRTGSVSGKQYTTCNKDIADNKSTNKKSTNKQMPKKAPSFSKPKSTARIDTSAPRKVGLESAFLKRQMTSGISGGGLDTALSKRGMISQPPAIRIDTSAPRKVGLESTFLNRQMKSQKEVEDMKYYRSSPDIRRAVRSLKKKGFSGASKERIQEEIKLIELESVKKTLKPKTKKSAEKRLKDLELDKKEAQLKVKKYKSEDNIKKLEKWKEELEKIERLKVDIKNKYKI